MVVLPAGTGPVPDAKAGQTAESSLFALEKWKFPREKLPFLPEYNAISLESAI
jgi:hypothetical protein